MHYRLLCMIYDRFGANVVAIREADMIARSMFTTLLPVLHVHVCISQICTTQGEREQESANLISLDTCQLQTT